MHIGREDEGKDAEQGPAIILAQNTFTVNTSHSTILQYFH